MEADVSAAKESDDSYERLLGDITKIFHTAQITIPTTPQPERKVPKERPNYTFEVVSAPSDANNEPDEELDEYDAAFLADIMK
jgi:hypothetical protein